MIGSLICKIKGKVFLDFFSILMKNCHLWDRRAYGVTLRLSSQTFQCCRAFYSFTYLFYSSNSLEIMFSQSLTFQPETNLIFFIKTKGLEIVSLKECYMRDKQMVCWTSFSVGAEISDALVINMSLSWALY